VTTVAEAFSTARPFAQMDAIDLAGGQLTTAPCELASQSICAALAALDECDLAFLLGAGDEGDTSPPSWRETFLTVCPELDLTT
jgi:hypothetical protein